MFKIFYHSLTSPKKLAGDVDKKASKLIGFGIILLIIFTLPSILNLVMGYGFTNDEATNIQEAFYEYPETINYEIKDGKLSSTIDNPYAQVLKVDSGSVALTSLPVYLIFDMSGGPYQLPANEPSLLIIFTEDNYQLLEVSTATNSLWGNYGSTPSSEPVIREIKTFDYADLAINFSDGKAAYTREFMLDIFAIGNTIYRKLAFKVLSIESLVVFGMNIGSFVFSTLFTAFLISLFYRFMGIRFCVILKIVFLTSTFFVVGSLLSFMYNSYIMSLLTEIISFVFAIRVVKIYSLNKIIEKRGGNTNEL